MKRTALLLTLLLAGCSEPSETQEAVDGPTGSSGADQDQLHGWVLDGTFTPIEGATISIHGENATATTGKDGGYGFTGLSTDRGLTLQVNAPGFVPQTRGLTLTEGTISVVNFTLVPVPVAQPYQEALTMKGIIGCSAIVRTQDSSQPYDCGLVSPTDNRVWEFNVNPDVATIVVEVFWDYNTELSSHLNLTVETVNLGVFDEILANEEGSAPLRGIVTRDQSARFYQNGGTVRATVDIGRNIDEEEAGAGAGLAVEQEFEIIATVFYVAPAPPDYTAA